MDKREAMLRELNLYPFWVRRAVPVLSSEEESQPVPLSRVDTCTVAVETPDQQSGRQEVVVKEVVAEEVVAEEVVAEEVVAEEVVAEEVVAEEVVAEEVVAEEVAPQGATLAEDLFSGNQLDDKPLTESVVASNKTLRDFQVKSQGGALAQVDWPELTQKIQDCVLCSLRAGCKKTVPGSGDWHADWMFIGDAPGEDDEMQGLPFMGHTGRLFDNMLMAIQLKRSENVYLANVIKCRPLDDRHPHVGEIAACIPYLKRQIGLVKPKLIVALGKTAASALLETEASIASLRGRVHDYKGIPLIVTYHPAYLFRSPLEKEKSWQDLCLAVASWQVQAAQRNTE
ncbi:MAG: uracil-DNA glycosylase [Gallionella sp.]